MSISNLTAMIIVNNEDLIFTYAGPDSNGKFSGWISMPNGRPVLNTQSVFDSSGDAKNHMLSLRDKLADKAINA
ncbi:hypothetical protein [Nitrosomonas sp.]|uniref:hypothetical protein n=1 Tax=Nitrosomonas sp. TaxID=42353 RepID=UPI0025DF7D97|nr:hypothetical protein [Nitrosomonas sp.]